MRLIRSSYLYSTVLFVISHILFVFSHILYMFSLTLFLSSLLFGIRSHKQVREDIVPQKCKNTENKKEYCIKNSNMENATRIAFFLMSYIILVPQLYFMLMILLMKQRYSESQSIRRIIHIQKKLLMKKKCRRSCLLKKL